MSNADMGIASADTFVIVALSLSLAQSPRATPQALEPVTDPDAYAIYAVLLLSLWGHRAEALLLLQQETDTSLACTLRPSRELGWEAVERSFNAENEQRRILRPELPLDIPYRLIARAEIAADDARLTRKYPGQWQHLPESIDYAAVSGVGFNATRTKAIVYVHLRNEGVVCRMEKRDDKWVRSPAGRCHWAA